MRLLILPGNHHANRLWAEDSQNACLSDFVDIVSIHYAHWDSLKNLNIDFEYELANLRTLVSETGDFDCILCKSAGVALAVMAIDQGVVSPVSAVLCGTPLNRSTADGVELLRLLGSIQCELTFIQEIEDPVCSANQLAAALHEVNASLSVQTVPGNRHQYDDIQLLSGIVRKTVAGKSDR